MGQAVAKIPETQDSISGVMAVIERAAQNPNVDVDKMMALLGMQERIMAKNAEIAYNEGMTRLQAKLPSVSKNGMIEFKDKNGVDRKTPFAKYEDIDAAIRPLLIEEGFSITFNSEWGEGATIFGTISHKDGHSKTASMRLPLDTSGSKNNLQAMGSTISYGKRYLVGMLLNIITKGEDDDGGAPLDPPATEPQQEAIKALLLKATEKARADFTEKYISIANVKRSQVDTLSAWLRKNAEKALAA